MNFRLRVAVGKDEAAIRELLHDTKLPSESLGNNITAFYVAENEMGVLGVAGFEFYGTDALLRSVAVKPGLQRQGVGSMIVDQMLGIAASIGICRVILLTENAGSFFLKKAFHIVERAEISNDELKRASEFTYACPSTAVCMVHELSPHGVPPAIKVRT